MPHRVDDFEGLLDLRTAYLRHVDAGADEFAVSLPSGAYGLSAEEASGTLSLAPVEGDAAMDVRLVSDGGPCVIVGIPLQIVGRRVTVENVAFVDTGSTALSVAASAGIELRGVTVLGCVAGRRQRAAVDLTAVAEGVTLSAERLVVDRAEAPTAAVGAFVNAGAWWQAVRLRGCAMRARDTPALLAVESTAELEVADCALRAPDGGKLAWLNWLPATARITGSALAAPALDTVVLPGPPPAETPPLALVDTLVTAPLSQLPDHVDGSGASEAAGETVDTRLQEAVAAAAAALVDVAPELRERVS